MHDVIEIKEALRRNITAYRIKRGMTKAQLARECGVSNPTVTNWENGRNSLDTEMLFRVSKALRVSVDVLSGQIPDDLSIAERDMLDKFRSLDPTQQEMIVASIEAAYSSVKKEPANISAS